MDIKRYLKDRKVVIDKELDKLIPKQTEPPQIIHKAMRYSLEGGKRARPILCMACAEACGGSFKRVIKIACAIEMIHAYSLIHDDLPSMDDDDYRRGRPACHKRFGIANAILTGDALLTFAFNILSEATEKPALNTGIIKEISRAIGTFGMIGGQALDISKDEKDIPTLEYINIRKTGALIASSCKTGAMAAGAKEKDVNAMFKFGEYIGFAFQVVDDILDGEGVVKIWGPKEAHKQAARSVKKAKAFVSFFGQKAKPLFELADFILDRKK